MENKMQDLKEVIARLEYQKEQENIRRSMGQLKKVGKFDEEGLEALHRQSVAFHNLKQADLPQSFLKKELDKLIPANLMALNEVAQKDMEAKMKREGLKSYKIALQMKQLNIPQLVEEISQELTEAQAGFDCVLKRKSALDSGETKILSETQLQKVKKVSLFIIKIKECALCDMLAGKCSKWQELSAKLSDFRETLERSRVSDPGIASLEDCVLQTMINPDAFEKAGVLIKKIQAFQEEFARNKSDVLAVGLTEYSFEETRKETLRQSTLQRQALENQAQGFVVALTLAETEAQRLANKEVNAGKPADAVAQETKLEDEEALLIGLRKFLDERIESSRKGLKEFVEQTVEKTKQTNFHHIFKTKVLFDKLGMLPNEKQLQFLSYMYKSNEQYYLSIKQQVELLKTPITLIGWSRCLEKIRALDLARFEDARKELKKLGIDDAGILRQLLIPVYRLVFKFQKEKLLSLTRLLTEAEVRIFCGKRAGLASAVQPVVIIRDNPMDDLQNLLKENLSLIEIIGRVFQITEKIQKDILKLQAQTKVSSGLTDAPEATAPEEPAAPEISFSSENFIADRELLQRANVFNLVSDLFSSERRVGYRDFYNMLRDLRGEDRIASFSEVHPAFQFPILWNGMRTAPQVTVGIYHTSGMPTASQIQDPNIIRDLRNACREAGMTPTIISAIQAESQNLTVTQSEATVAVTAPAVVEATVSSETVQPHRRRARRNSH